jgi:2-amino-4-hydroxy-6-hydroxymethyldihydropteridine diphosphokinase
LQAIEGEQGRVRDGLRWGPRTLDLDILLYGDAQVDLPGLRIPHPELTRRAFVLVPLADVAPLGLLIPGRGTLAELIERCPRQGVARLGAASTCGVAGQLADSPL